MSCLKANLDSINIPQCFSSPKDLQNMTFQKFMLEKSLQKVESLAMETLSISSMSYLNHRCESIQPLVNFTNRYLNSAVNVAKSDFFEALVRRVGKR